MLMNNSLGIGYVMLEDCKRICDEAYIPWEKLHGKTFFITGATGLIGKNLVRALLYANHQRNLNMKFILLVRSMEKFRAEYGDIKENTVIPVIGDVVQLPDYEISADYIVHAASPTSSSFFMNNPVETIHTMVQGTRNILELAKKWNVEGMVYLSTMEVYGYPERGHSVTESEVSGFDTSIVRNCYPISKQACECMCNSYAKEYNIPIKCLRLTQTFGAGVDYHDGRVFAQFMRCVLEEKDIVLKTKGETERCYLYTADCTAAILTVLLKGEAGTCYNAANPETYCSIFEMAQLVASEVASGRIAVRVEEEDISKFGYANTLFMQLDCSKLMELGWYPVVNLADMYKKMIEDIDINNK